MLAFLQPWSSPRQRQSPTQGLTLRDDFIIETVAKLQRRISERFPDSGLCTLCGELLDVARRASERSNEIARPIVWIRIAGYAVTVAMLILTVWYLSDWMGAHDLEVENLPSLVSTINDGANSIVLFAASVYFLVSWETRIKRERAIDAIHELRSICHIIDMHQLTKDPERVLKIWKSTPNSPRHQMTPLELNRYLDYCTEMLSLTGKIAALYIRDFNDAASVASVSDLEQLSTGLARKIWQKIMILEQSLQRNMLIEEPKSPESRLHDQEETND
jgi:hypothetical protein